MKSRSPVEMMGPLSTPRATYIQLQFAQPSWWPIDGPLRAQAHFAAMQDTLAGLRLGTRLSDRSRLVESMRSIPLRSAGMQQRYGR